MKYSIAFLVVLFSSFSPSRESSVEFVCLKTNKASNVCYYNFIIDGVRHSYTDWGCKQVKKKDQLIEKVKQGKLALVRDWKIECASRPD